MSLRDAWDEASAEWIEWARRPDHDSYWRFHREALLGLLPAPGVLTVDIGCGEGRVARDLSLLGHRVVALDGSYAMAHAAATHPDAQGPVVVADAARLPLRDGCADLAVAFMSLQDVDDYRGALAEAGRVLRDGGVLVLAIVHPVNEVGHFEDSDDPDSRFVVDADWYAAHRYSDRCARDGLQMTFHSEHRPVSDYVDALADAGFLIERIREPTDPDPSRPWHRIPMFLHVRALRSGPADPDDKREASWPEPLAKQQGLRLSCGWVAG
ncbi:MAG TPA: class I SAM-dependent methyltransferase [Mycobacteriales bacterium]|nr:class I SAM-dependent methyltransferase [Mycobacteriales bacterium]